MQEILSKIRKVEDSDRGRLLSVSHSKLELASQCTYKYYLKYIKGNYSNSSTLSLQLGSILHKALELKGIAKIEKKDIDYDAIHDIVINGCVEEKGDHKEVLVGTNSIQKTYFEEWLTKDEKSGMNYKQKMQLFFDEVMPTRMEDEDWEVIGTEVDFDFVYTYGQRSNGNPKEVIVHGFIDRVDRNKETGELRIVDYKSSKKVFDEAKIRTPQQMIIYDMACVLKYNQLPAYHEYDFILLNKKQTTEDGVCSKGYLKRGLSKIDKLLTNLDDLQTSMEYQPSPTPLCYWCDFHTDSPNASDKYRGLCQYHSLWSPTSRNFSVLNEFNNEPIKEERKPVKRKLVF